MSEIRKANVPDATYFVTLTVVGWVDVFSRKEYAEEIIASLIHCQQHKGLELFAYLIENSVLAGLVTRPEHYRWSSAHPESAILVMDV